MEHAEEHDLREADDVRWRDPRDHHRRCTIAEISGHCACAGPEVAGMG